MTTRHNKAAPRLIGGVVGRNGWTPLHIAVWSDDLDKVEELLHQGAETGAVISEKDPEDNLQKATPLIISIILGNREIFNTLLPHTSSITDIGPLGCNATEHAANKGQNEMVKALYATGGQIREARIGFALSHAVGNGNIDLITYVASAGLNLSTRPSLLSLAARKGHIETAKKLMEVGCNINSVTDGYTPLMTSAFHGSLEGVEFLLKSGADVNAEVNGETALKIAKRLRRTKIARLLQEAGTTANPRPAKKIPTNKPQTKG